MVQSKIKLTLLDTAKALNDNEPAIPASKLALINLAAGESAK